MNRSDLERARRAAPIEDLTFERLTQRRERKELRRRAGALAVSLTIGVLAAGGVFLAFRDDGAGVGLASSGTPSTTWTMPSGLVVPAGSYAYVRSVEYGGGGTSERQTWFSPTDGSGGVDDHRYGPGEMTNGHDPNTASLAGLSTDPAVLADQLIRRSAPDGASPIPVPSPDPNVPEVTGSVAAAIYLLLGMDNATPELKAALSQVLVRLEGVTTNPAASDPVGRPAWSVRLEEGTRVNVWWFDPQSDQLLASEIVEPGTSFYTIYEASGVVGDIGATSTQPSFFPSTSEPPPLGKA